ncbi:MAG: T9SS type A sorting domain-containing protein [Bacteroidia bacterium]|nr:T9SS type A sorting domain-containing protein [Bacteroidia bacterium]
MRRRLFWEGLQVLLVIFIPDFCQAQNLLSGPQKIVIDAPRNRLLVSNYNTGDLIGIDSAGKQSYFLKGAGFVDGLEIVGDVVYGVGNNRKVLGYDLATKRQVMNLTLSGNAANYLSSITSDSTGHLFISCPILNEIYRLRLSDYTYWVFAKGNGLNKPNGILLEKEKNRIVVIDDSPRPSLIHAISLADSTVTTLASTTFNSPDGIVRDKYGYHYIGGYYLSGLYRTDADFSYAPEKFFTGTNMVYPTYDPLDHTLLITFYETNSWARVPLPTSSICSNTLPGNFIIYPVSPNPFNSGATIKFDLNKPVRVKVDVYNSAGLLVTTLVNEEKDPGSYSAIWNGNDHAGKQADNGVFFIRMATDGNVQTQKAILIR